MNINRRIEKLEKRQPRELREPEPLVIKPTDDDIRRFFDGELKLVPEDYDGPVKWDLSALSYRTLKEMEADLIQRQEAEQRAEESQEG